MVVQQNETILRRFEQVNLHVGAENGSTRFLEDDVSTIRGRRTLHENFESSSYFLGLPVPEGSILAQDERKNANSSRDFENILNETRVYKRVQSNQCDVSFTTSIVRTHAWSMLSDLSLSDISAISIIALPVSLEEINNIGANLTFANMLSLSGVHDVAQTEGAVIIGAASVDGPLGDQIIESSIAQVPEITQDEAVLGLWIPQTTPDMRLYYFNTFTGESTWELPVETSTAMNNVETRGPIATLEAQFLTSQAMPDETVSQFNVLNTRESPLDASASAPGPRPGKQSFNSPLVEAQNNKLKAPEAKPSYDINRSQHRSKTAQGGMQGKLSLYKLVILGDGGVDKTALAIQVR